MLFPRWRNPASRALILVAGVLMVLSITVFDGAQALTAPQVDAARQRRMQRINPQMPAPLKIDPQRVAAAGISVLSGKHITLYTDVRADLVEGETDPRQRWIELFDAAVPAWCEQFDTDRADAENYALSAIIMQDQQRFRNAGLIPADLPKFPAGYSRGHEFWMFVQPEDYYTRHLILHEGTHAWMNWFLGSTGPPWFSEGMAEWVALHRRDEERLILAAKIALADDSRGWGRIGRINRMVAAGSAMSLDDVMNIPPSAFREVKYYAWSWAACEFFSEHPLSARAFVRLQDTVGQAQTEFNQSFFRAIKPHRDALDRDWALFVNELDYGYDVRRTRLTEAVPIATEPAGAQAFQVSATHSWQSTGLKVRRGDRLRISASGEVVVGQTTRPWVSQAAGITVDYYSGQPLGKLMASVVPETLSQEDVAAVGGVDSIPVGTGMPVPVVNLHKINGTRGFNGLAMPRDGVLWLRINESPTRLRDNSGHLEVSIFRLK